MYTPISQDQLEDRLRAARAERARVLAELLRRIPSALGKFFAGWTRRAERNAAIRELGRLDDAMLKDIGLYRGDIWYAAEATSRGIDVRDQAPVVETTPVLRPLPDTGSPANDNRDRATPALAGAGRA